MKIRKFAVVLTVLLFCFILGGCGSDSRGAQEKISSEYDAGGISVKSPFSPDMETSSPQEEPMNAGTAEAGESVPESETGEAAEKDYVPDSYTQSDDGNSKVEDKENSGLDEGDNRTDTVRNEDGNERRPEEKTEEQAVVLSAQGPGAQSEAEISDVCTFSIDCSRALESPELSDSLRNILPENGVIFSGTVAVEEGDSAYDILSRITREKGIPMEFSSSPAFGSKYIEGINSLRELDCGPNSGWVYFINGEMPGVGCDKTSVKPGDDVRFCYTLDLGTDIDI